MTIRSSARSAIALGLGFLRIAWRYRPTLRLESSESRDLAPDTEIDELARDRLYSMQSFRYRVTYSSTT
jgi:hypothetical protein